MPRGAAPRVPGSETDQEPSHHDEDESPEGEQRAEAENLGRVKAHLRADAGGLEIGDRGGRDPYRLGVPEHDPAENAAQHVAGGEHQVPAALLGSEEHTSELQSPGTLVSRLLLEKKKYI